MAHLRFELKIGESHRKSLASRIPEFDVAVLICGIISRAEVWGRYFRYGRCNSPSIVVTYDPGPYNCKVDVFASTILLWEVLSLQRAYFAIGVPQGQFFKDCVAIYNDRPPIQKKWPKQLRKVMKQGWIKDIAARPTSGKMRASLQKIVDEYRHGR